MVRLKVQENNTHLKVNNDTVRFTAGATTPVPMGTSDYNDLESKPSIGGVTLEGNKSLEELGAFDGDYNSLTNKPNLFSGDYNDLINKPSLFSGDYNDLTNKPNIPSRTSQLVNNSGFITADDIPPLVTDLGEIDGDLYDWDVEAFLNTLQETGSYVFLWDEFKYWVDIEALEVEGTTTVQQIYWDTEEGGITIYYRNLVIENGEIVRVDTTNFLTFDEANVAFARNAHTHVRFDSKSQSIWDFCNTVAVSNTNPFVIYFDLSTSKTYLIETFVGTRQPVYKLQKVTEMNDTSYFCQRSSYYYSGAEHWGDWYKFIGEVFDPNGR